MNVLTKLHQAPSPALRLLVAGLLLVLAFAGGYAVSDYKTVTLNVDGTAMTVKTMKSRVIDIIRENGFNVSERDDLYPAVGERVRNARELRDAVRLIPTAQLLVETDAPFLTPHPYRGAPNEPYCLPYTIRALAEVIDRPADELAEITTGNARRTYRLAAIS